MNTEKLGDYHIIHDWTTQHLLIHLDTLQLSAIAALGRLDGVARGTVLISENRASNEHQWTIGENIGKNGGKIMKESPWMAINSSNPKASAEHWISFPLRSLSMHWGKLFCSLHGAGMGRLFNLSETVPLYHHLVSFWTYVNQSCRFFNFLRLSQLHVQSAKLCALVPGGLPLQRTNVSNLGRLRRGPKFNAERVFSLQEKKCRKLNQVWLFRSIILVHSAIFSHSQELS